MDIPYTVSARPDTGLYNAKVGVWLFLASEVMLFGALFSSYILLRVGASAWPHGLLNVPIGTFNTTVLITSSITMVMAWANMKLGNPRRSRIYLAATILCALMFLGIKSVEYHDKFVHYEVRLTDGTVMDGHIEKGSKVTWLKGNHFKVTPESTLVFQPIEVFEGKPGETLTEARQERGLAKPGMLAPSHSHEKVRMLQGSQVDWISNYVPRHSTYFALYFTLTGLHALHVIGGMVVLGYLCGPGFRLARLDGERYTNRLEIAGLFWHFVDLVWIFLFPVLYLL